jgi:hypothetical protein
VFVGQGHQVFDGVLNFTTKARREEDVMRRWSVTFGGITERFHAATRIRLRAILRLLCLCGEFFIFAQMKVTHQI